MKIGISSIGNSMESKLDVRFGRCSFFAVVDIDTRESKYIANSAQTASGGAGIDAAQVMIDNDVDVVITGNMGPNAFNVMTNAEIKVYRCSSVPVKMAVQLFENAKLQQITEAGPAHAGMNL